MQLSLPSIPSSTPAAPKPGGAKNSSTSGTSTDSADAAPESFDSLLPKNGRADKPAKAVDEKSDSDAEQAAAILTAGFWMPMVQPVAPTPDPTISLGAASAATGSIAGSAAATLADGSATSASLLTSTSPRAFGAVVQAGVESVTPKVGSDSKTGLPVGPDPTAATTAAAAAAGSQMTAQIPSSGPISVKRGGGASATTSADKLAVTKTKSLIDSEQSAPATSDTVPVIKVSAQNRPDADAQSPVPEDAMATKSSKDEPDPSASFGSDVAKAATTLAEDARKLTNSAQEKIAALTDGASQLAKNQVSAAEKYFLNTGQKPVASTGPALGTSIARMDATMASSSAPARQKSDSTNESTTSFVFSADPAPTATLTLDAPAPVATVRETMAAVISAVDALERRADVQQKSVDLQFNVGSEKLGLRVELRDGTVHTTFRTESSEMNSALTHEWHEIVQPALAREIHLAEPVFHSASASGNAVPAASSDSATTAFGNGAQQQREQPKAPATFASALKREFYESASPEVTAAVSSVSNSSQLLNALA